jgi:hypothetical protein
MRGSSAIGKAGGKSAAPQCSALNVPRLQTHHAFPSEVYEFHSFKE